MTVEGVSVKVAESGTRAKCLEGFTCLLESINMVINWIWLTSSP